MTPEIKTAVEALLNDTRVKLMSVRVDLRARPEFTKSTLAKRVKALGGRYSKALGNTRRRFVELPMQSHEAFEALVQLLQLPQDDAYSARDKACLCWASKALFETYDGSHTPRMDSPQTVQYFRPGESLMTAERALKLVQAQHATMTYWAEQQLTIYPKIRWSTDHELPELKRQHAIKETKRWIAHNEEQLQVLRAKLAELQAQED